VTFLPVVGRELRVIARLPGTHWSRLTAALVALGVGGWIMLVPVFRNTPGYLGKALFISMSVIANFYAVLMGVLRTADSVSEEKREGTLGLLFLTDLKGYDIVMGKLAATSLNTFYAMLGVFPILAISLLVGGVTGTEFWRVVIISVTNLLFSMALGMFCSSISRDEKKALVLALLLMLFFTAGLPFLAALSEDWNQGRQAEPIFMIPSPSCGLYMAFDKGSTPSNNPDYFYAAVTTLQALSWILLALACLIVPRTWQDKAASTESSRRVSLWRQLLYGTGEGRKKRRIWMLDQNPFYWLTSRDRVKTFFVWAFLMAFAFLWGWGLLYDPDSWKRDSNYVLTALVAHTVIKFWLAAEACRQISLDRKAGALELLLSTPLSVAEIIHGQLRSLRRQFLLPVALILFFDFLFLTAQSDDDWTLLWIAGISMFIADLVTLSWMGMWLGLTSRSITRAASAALVRVLVLPWLAFLALLTFIAISSIALSRIMPRGPDTKMLICIWMFFGFLNNVIFGFWAARKLQSEFRVVATRRFEHGRRRGAAPPPASPTVPAENGDVAVQKEGLPA
jgi:ABC-type transport system involved in multi-copper enzyme maturation permease subunit